MKDARGREAERTSRGFLRSGESLMREEEKKRGKERQEKGFIRLAGKNYTTLTEAYGFGKILCGKAVSKIKLGQKKRRGKQNQKPHEDVITERFASD